MPSVKIKWCSFRIIPCRPHKLAPFSTEGEVARSVPWGEPRRHRHRLRHLHLLLHRSTATVTVSVSVSVLFQAQCSCSPVSVSVQFRFQFEFGFWNQFSARAEKLFCDSRHLFVEFLRAQNNWCPKFALRKETLRDKKGLRKPFSERCPFACAVTAEIVWMDHRLCEDGSILNDLKIGNPPKAGTRRMRGPILRGMEPGSFRGDPASQRR